MFAEAAVNSLILPYTEVFYLDIGLMSVLRAAAKVLDLMVGFYVASVSDNLNTSCGRRLPFILPACFISGLCMHLLARPEIVTESSHNISLDDVPCMSLQSSNCSAVRACIEKAVLRHELPDPSDSTQGPAPEASLQLAVFFFVLYTLRYSCGHTVAHIPYDALGQELTTKSHERIKLFSLKSSASIGGNFLGLFLTAVLAQFFSTDMALQSRVFNAFALTFLICTAAVMTICVRERNTRVSKQDAPGSLFVTLKQLLDNSAYFNYLVARLLQAAGYFCHAGAFTLWIKYVLQFENTNLAYASIGMPTIFFALHFIRVVSKSMERRGKNETFVMFTSVLFVELVITSLMPYSILREHHYWMLHSVFMGLALSTVHTIPENMMSDIIDYDELCFGVRREAIFVVFDHNITQFMDVLGGMLPGAVLAAYDYRGNGGCLCGCGSPCPHYFMRWSCPGDIGYACTADLSEQNMVFFGTARHPPCTQQTELVHLIIVAFCFWAPAALYIATAVVAFFSPMTASTQKMIGMMKSQKARSSHWYDAVRMTVRTSTQRSGPGTHALNHFSEAEQHILSRKDGLMVLSLRWRAIVILLLLIICLLAMNITSLSFVILFATLIPSLAGMLWFSYSLLLLYSFEEDLRACVHHSGFDANCLRGRRRSAVSLDYQTLLNVRKWLARSRRTLFTPSPQHFSHDMHIYSGAPKMTAELRSGPDK